MLGEQELAGHERVCAAWRKRLAEAEEHRGEPMQLAEPKETTDGDSEEDEES
jgi:hypothetical protein